MRIQKLERDTGLGPEILMNVHSPSELVLRGFRIATMVDPSVDFICDISNRLIGQSDHHVDYGLLENVSIGVSDGKIAWLALDEEIAKAHHQPRQLVDGKGALLTPGLIDCHTHLVYGGNRATEWEMRLNGKSYQEIAMSGGGILSSVLATRMASEPELFESASGRLKRLMSEGVTTIEIKSGYGLDVESELKMLRVARQLERQYPVSVESTLLGAHAIPPEFAGKADDYVRLVCEEMIPRSINLCSSVDVF